MCSAGGLGLQAQATTKFFISDTNRFGASPNHFALKYIYEKRRSSYKKRID